MSEESGSSGVRLAEVTKRFGAVAAVDRATFEVAAGTLAAVLGPSGCGKSTLLRAIAGFETIDDGRIFLAGRDITTLPLRERRIGFVFQHYALFPHMDVAKNIAFALDVRGGSARTTAARVDELLELVQLPRYGRRYPHELSGGQRQRVALARALAGNPSLLLLDEPFAALDLQVRRELRAWLRRLHELVPVTTLLVTHDAEEAMEIADRLVLMQDGRIEQVGTPLDVYNEPVSPFALQLLGPADAIPGDAGVAFVRPHDVRVESASFDGSHPAQVTRVVALGSRTRLELRLESGATLHADVSVRRADGLLGAAGPPAALHVAALQSRTFPAPVLERN
jgi:sulfate transport system ATP-binding protein